MKKFTLAALSFAFVSNVFAGTAYTPGTDTSTTGSAAPEVFTYTAAADRAGFVKNDFDFTLSAWSVATAVESADVRALSVGAVSVRGRSLYTGNSDGGSVAQCGDSLTSTEAKTVATVLALLGDVDASATNVNGCVAAAAPPAA